MKCKDVTLGALDGVYRVATKYWRPFMSQTSSAKNSLGESAYMRTLRSIALFVLAMVSLARIDGAQVPAKDPSARLREVLPADVADRVLARIADARSHQLPADALENRALKFAAKGVDPRNIERSINEQALRMDSAKSALERGRGSAAAGDEIEAGAEAMRKGVDGQAVSLLAKSAPHNRSLAVPLFVIGSLTDRGLSADQALQRVLTRLKARASDADLEGMSSDVSGRGNAGQGRGDGDNGRGEGRALGRTGRPATAGPPAGVPGNSGSKSNGQRRGPPPKGSTSN